MRATASAVPIEYGPNSVLGVVDIQTPVSLEPGLDSVQAEIGTQDSGSLSATAGREFDHGAAGLSLSALKLDADGSIVNLDEREITAFNMLGAPRGYSNYGVGDYIGVAGLAASFEIAFVQSNCGPQSIACATTLSPPRYKDVYVYIP